MAAAENIPGDFFALERFNQSNPQNGKTRYVNLSAIMVWLNSGGHSSFRRTCGTKPFPTISHRSTGPTENGCRFSHAGTGNGV
jgi:hypothetical protein